MTPTETHGHLFGPQLQDRFGISFIKAYTNRLLSENPGIPTISYHSFLCSILLFKYSIGGKESQELLKVALWQEAGFVTGHTFTRRAL